MANARAVSRTPAARTLHAAYLRECRGTLRLLAHICTLRHNCACSIARSRHGNGAGGTVSCDAPRGWRGGRRFALFARGASSCRLRVAAMGARIIAQHALRASRKQHGARLHQLNKLAYHRKMAHRVRALYRRSTARIA